MAGFKEQVLRYFKPTNKMPKLDAIGQAVKLRNFSEQSSKELFSSLKKGMKQSEKLVEQQKTSLKNLVKQAMAEEEELVKQWQQNPYDPELTQRVLKSIEPIIRSATGKWSGVLPNNALFTKAQVLALEALKTWDPRQGKISTYLFPRLQKISRDVYSMQNAVKIPEHHITQMGTFEQAYHDLYARLGRAPTVEELADDLVWSPDMVKRFLKYSQKEITTSDMADELVGDVYIDFRPETLNALGLVKATLKEKEKCVYTSLVDSPITPPTSQIKQKCKISDSELSRIRKRIAKKIQEYRGY